LVAPSLYQDNRFVFNCGTKAAYGIAETTTFNGAGLIISDNHVFKEEAAATKLFPQWPAPNTFVSHAARIACDEALGDQVKNAKTYLSPTPANDGKVFYAVKKLFGSPYQYEILLVTKLFQDHTLTELFSVEPVLNSPHTYRSYAKAVQINCTDRMGQRSKTDNFDAQGNLVYINLYFENSFEVENGTDIGELRSRICGGVAGTYEGTITMTYKSGVKSEQRISITIEQTGNNVNVTYQTGSGAQGKGAGTLENGRAELQSTTYGCAGAYEAFFKFADDSMTLSLKGDDCGSPLEGNATAKKVKA
jgi:hypothetical protein